MSQMIPTMLFFNRKNYQFLKMPFFKGFMFGMGRIKKHAVTLHMQENANMFLNTKSGNEE